METTSLFVKVALLLSMSMLCGAAGTWFGRNVRSMGACIGLGIVFLLGTFGVFMAAHAGPVVGICALGAWTLVSGLFIGPAVGQFSEEFGWHTVGGIFAGTAGAMAVSGMIGLFSGIDFSGMGHLPDVRSLRADHRGRHRHLRAHVADDEHHLPRARDGHLHGLLHLRLLPPRPHREHHGEGDSTDDVDLSRLPQLLPTRAAALRRDAPQVGWSWGKTAA